MAFVQAAVATPITGGIGFDGTVQLDSTTVGAATKAIGWSGATVNTASGSFAPLGNSSALTLTPTWLFNAGPVQNFWSVGGFNFNLSTSAIFSQDAACLNVFLAGNVSGNGYENTAFTGTFQINQQPVNGVTKFSQNYSFNGVPDGGSTILLLGAAMSGLVLIRRKLNA
ncbi:MAG: motif [Verrucomicrobiota bacterium]